MARAAFKTNCVSMEDQRSFRFTRQSLYGVLFVVMFLVAGVLGFLQQRTVIEPYRVGATVLDVEITQTARDRERGLSGRDTVGRADGMLFVFPEAGRHGIWMKEMRFDIDIIWVAEGKIVDIAPRVPYARDAQELPVYYPRLDADWVVEVPAGTAEREGWKIGGPVVALDGK